ncbi:MAG: filamentous hemagglutinin N-terminal domain-containing protein [Proteobacteria bacterium]|nr:MAG: filamentous hemagglutinin N-terminal domain-containing protein [Pseudomonadota bacterium]
MARIRPTTLALALACFPFVVAANPQGGSVVAGEANIVHASATQLDVLQRSDKAVIDWRSFSIGSNEQVRFEQPSASAVTLNRVTGDDASRILGRLTANGRVFLVNPNGIHFGKGAEIDVAGLVASTHDIRNEDFMAGRFDFAQNGLATASIINDGAIRVADTGAVAFVAPSVANRGVIAARLGQVALASASRFTLDFTGDALLSFAVDDTVAQTAFDQDGNRLQSFVDNSGRIEANGGVVLLSARAAENVVHSVINQRGRVEAMHADTRNGEIILSGGEHGTVSVTGTLDVSGKATGQTGGRIIVTGQNVQLDNGARLDASGHAGGGRILVGGDHMGGQITESAQAQFGIRAEDEPIANARTVFIDEGVVLDASAIDTGNGGKITVWADASTDFLGTALARGGARGGNGGVVEISAGKRVAALGQVDISAPAGTPGLRLIDPEGIIYASTTGFLLTFTSPDYARIIDWQRDPNDENVLYLLSVKSAGTSTWRSDPDGSRAYPVDILVTKIVAGTIVAQNLVDTVYGTYHGIANSALRGTFSVAANEVRIFFSEKTPVSSNYGQTGYIYRLNKTNLAQSGSRETLFDHANWGWYPFFDDNGNLNHFSFAGYYAVLNTSQGAWFTPRAFEEHAIARRLNATPVGVRLTWDLLSSELLARTQAAVEEDADTPPPPNSLTPAQQGLIDTYRNATTAELLVAVGSGLFVNNPLDPVWSGLYANDQATTQQVEANRLQPLYDKYRAASAATLLAGLRGGELKTSSPVWSALGVSNASARASALAAYLNTASERKEACATVSDCGQANEAERPQAPQVSMNTEQLGGRLIDSVLGSAGAVNNHVATQAVKSLLGMLDLVSDPIGDAAKTLDEWNIILTQLQEQLVVAKVVGIEDDIDTIRKQIASAAGHKGAATVSLHRIIEANPKALTRLTNIAGKIAQGAGAAGDAIDTAAVLAKVLKGERIYAADVEGYLQGPGMTALSIVNANYSPKAGVVTAGVTLGLGAMKVGASIGEMVEGKTVTDSIREAAERARTAAKTYDDFAMALLEAGQKGRSWASLEDTVMNMYMGRSGTANALVQEIETLTSKKAAVTFLATGNLAEAHIAAGIIRETQEAIASYTYEDFKKFYDAGRQAYDGARQLDALRMPRS